MYLYPSGRLIRNIFVPIFILTVTLGEMVSITIPRDSIEENDLSAFDLVNTPCLGIFRQSIDYGHTSCTFYFYVDLDQLFFVGLPNLRHGYMDEFKINILGLTLETRVCESLEL